MNELGNLWRFSLGEELPYSLLHLYFACKISLKSGWQLTTMEFILADQKKGVDSARQALGLSGGLRFAMIGELNEKVARAALDRSNYLHYNQQWFGATLSS